MITQSLLDSFNKTMGKVQAIRATAELLQQQGFGGINLIDSNQREASYEFAKLAGEFERAGVNVKDFATLIKQSDEMNKLFMWAVFNKK